MDGAVKLSSAWNRDACRSTFLLFAVPAYVTAVAVQRARRGVRLAAMVLRIQCVDRYVNQMQQDLADVTVSVRILHKKMKAEKHRWLFRRGSFPLELARYFSQGSFGIKRKIQKKTPQNITSYHGLILKRDRIPCLLHRTTDSYACQFVVTIPFGKITWRKYLVNDYNFKRFPCFLTLK